MLVRRYRRSMRRVLIVGASRGIGLGLVDVHLAAGWEVHATTRDGSAVRDHQHVVAHRLDVRRERQLDRLIDELDEPLARIVHNAGIKGGSFEKLVEVNVDAPIRVVDRLLEAGRLESGGVVALMSSQAGSRRGGSGPMNDYGQSKALLNDAFRDRAETWGELGAIAVALHPGWVRTDMGGPSAPLGVEESTEGILHVLDGLTPADHGRFLTWDGREQPW